jgi:TRAP-type C4-dicarboxylate transport system substrate-binding protein
MQGGFWNLGYAENGIRHVTNSRTPIRSPEDLRGMRIRTMENPMHLAYFRELGANPTPMSWGELYTALQQGVVDAQENPFVMIYDGRFYEVQRYVSETGHFFSAKLLIANRDFIENLPADLRDIVIQAGHNWALAQRRLIAEREGGFRARLLEHGMQFNVLTDEERAPFIAAASAVFEQFKDVLGEEILEIARQYQR